MPGYVPLPEWFQDPDVSDTELQERWTAGAELALQRALERQSVARREYRHGRMDIAELAACEAEVERLTAFVADAQRVRAMYRHGAGRR